MSGTEPAPALMTAKEVAEYLRVDKNIIYRLLKARQLPAFRVGSDWRFKMEDIDRWRLSAPQGVPAHGSRRSKN